MLCTLSLFEAAVNSELTWTAALLDGTLAMPI